MVLSPELTIWAGGSYESADHENVVYWDRPLDQSGGRSLIDYIEIHADELRRTYLAWAHELGDVEIDGRKLRDHFRLADNTDLWSQSAFVEQSPWKQPSIEILLRIFAIERILDTERPSSLLLVSHSRQLNIVISRVCATRGIEFVWRSIRRNWRRQSPQLRSVVRGLPHVIQGALALTYLAVTRLCLRRRRRLRGQDGRQQVAICGPLFSLSQDQVGAFISGFWTKLPGILAEADYGVLWLHFFYAHKEITNVRAAQRKIDALNSTSAHGDTHCLVDEYFSAYGALRVAQRWLSITVKSIYLGHVLRRRSLQAVRESFWPVIREDWGRAFRGVGGIESLYYAECWNRTMECVSPKSECIYLMENQGWERSLMRAWRMRPHGRLTGVAHTSIRFWDLRYHCDPRRYEVNWRGQVPVPDAVVLNGRAMQEAYFATTRTREPTVCCEALRYLHLRPGSAQLGRRQESSHTFRLLVLGSYFRAATTVVLNFLAHCRDALGTASEIWLKPHPNAQIDVADFPGLALKVCDNSVANLVPEVNLVLACGSTTAALDAYITGCVLAVYDDGSSPLNYSPVRGLAGVRYIRGKSDVEEIISAIRQGSMENVPVESDLLIVDPALPRWRQYFGIPAQES
jgi:surface carbohydrate biosynthesis protein (TIGR04326 family)